MTLILVIHYQNLILGLQINTEAISLSQNLQKPISHYIFCYFQSNHFTCTFQYSFYSFFTMYLAFFLRFPAFAFFTLHVACSLWNPLYDAFTLHYFYSLYRMEFYSNCYFNARDSHLVESFFYFYITNCLCLKEFFLYRMWLIP